MAEKSKIVLKIWVEDDIIYLEMGGNIAEEHLKEFQEWAEENHKTVLEVYQKTKEKIKFLTDVSKLEYMDKKITDAFVDLLKINKPYVFKSATFGGKIPTMILLTFSTVVSDRADFQHFKTKKEALEWLKEAKPPI